MFEHYTCHLLKFAYNNIDNTISVSGVRFDCYLQDWRIAKATIQKKRWENLISKFDPKSVPLQNIRKAEEKLATLDLAQMAAVSRSAAELQKWVSIRAKRWLLCSLASAHHNFQISTRVKQNITSAELWCFSYSGYTADSISQGVTSPRGMPPKATQYSIDTALRT